MPMPHQSAMCGAGFQRPRAAGSNSRSCLRTEQEHRPAAGQSVTFLLEMFGEMQNLISHTEGLRKLLLYRENGCDSHMWVLHASASPSVPITDGETAAQQK